MTSMSSATAFASRRGLAGTAMQPTFLYPVSHMVVSAEVRCSALVAHSVGPCIGCTGALITLGMYHAYGEALQPLSHCDVLRG